MIDRLQAWILICQLVIQGCIQLPVCTEDARACESLGLNLKGKDRFQAGMLAFGKCS
jgi:hypothetical protein